MKYSFVHRKVVLIENCAITGSINMDLRSFYQQFESAVYITDSDIMSEIYLDFENVFNKFELLQMNNQGNKKYLIVFIQKY